MPHGDDEPNAVKHEPGATNLFRARHRLKAFMLKAQSLRLELTVEFATAAKPQRGPSPQAQSSAAHGSELKAAHECPVRSNATKDRCYKTL